MQRSLILNSKRWCMINLSIGHHWVEIAKYQRQSTNTWNFKILMLIKSRSQIYELHSRANEALALPLVKLAYAFSECTRWTFNEWHRAKFTQRHQNFLHFFLSPSFPRSLALASANRARHHTHTCIFCARESKFSWNVISSWKCSTKRSVSRQIKTMTTPLGNLWLISPSPTNAAALQYVPRQYNKMPPHISASKNSTYCLPTHCCVRSADTARAIFYNFICKRSRLYRIKFVRVKGVPP